jgi:heme oxygenase
MSDPDPTPGVSRRLALLRAGTAAAHASIETVPALARLLAPDLTPAEYVVVLRRMDGFLAVCEPAIAAALADACPPAAALLDGARRRALAEDLAWYGVAALPLAEALPAFSDPPAAQGGLYVIEGAGLGARVIGRHLQATLGVAPGAGGSFYCGATAAGARARWQLLRAVLDAPGCTHPAADDRLLAGANATFCCLERWMRRVDVVALPTPRAAWRRRCFTGAGNHVTPCNHLEI